SPHQQAAEPTADHDDADVVHEGSALDGLAVRVIEIVRERVGHLDILIVPVGAEALVALGTVLLAKGLGVEGLHADGRSLRGDRRPSRAAGASAFPRRCWPPRVFEVAARYPKGSALPGDTLRRGAGLGIGLLLRRGVSFSSEPPSLGSAAITEVANGHYEDD